MNTTAALPEALRDALGAVIANERREWRRERELIQAQAALEIAELKSRVVDLEARLDRKLDDRLATVKDGRDGEPGAAGPSGERGEVGPPGHPGPVGPMGERGEPGMDGIPGERGLDGKDGSEGQQGPQGERGETGQQGERGLPGQDGSSGERGERGETGPPGKLPIVREWARGVWYEGQVVTRGGSSFQALRDTAEEPPHDDWATIAKAKSGQDGRGFAVRGTWEPATQYKTLDVVARNGGSFVALKDNPGECPGPDWQLFAGPGKRGQPGERGLTGPKGETGRDGAGFIGWVHDLENYRAIPVLSDGSHGEPLEVRSFLERLIAERGL